MAKSSVQGAFRRAKLDAGVHKKGVSVHTLRLSYATHLLETGVNLRVIQKNMGHTLIFKAKFRDAMKEADLFDQIPSEIWQLDWNVNSQAVGSSEPSLQYLAAYVFKVAISNSRILKVQNDTIFFQYKKSHSHRLRTMALDAMEFFRRFLQHALPTGFMKIRYYGFLNPNCAVPLEKITTLIQMAYAFTLEIPEYEENPPQLPTCPHCGGALHYRASFPPFSPLQISSDTS